MLEITSEDLPTVYVDVDKLSIDTDVVEVISRRSAELDWSDFKELVVAVAEVVCVVDALDMIVVDDDNDADVIETDVVNTDIVEVVLKDDDNEDAELISTEDTTGEAGNCDTVEELVADKEVDEVVIALGESV